MKTGILLFEQVQGKKDIGSSRIRGHWIVRHWKEAGPEIGEAEIFKHGGKYDAVIYQKAYFLEHAKAFDGIKIFDLCDPDWFDWGYHFKEMLEAVDGITCSSLELSKAVQGFTKKPVYFIKDRVDSSIVPPPKKHIGPTKKIVWFGYSHNFPMLDASMPALKKRGLDLIVVSDDVYVLPSGFSDMKLSNLPWSDNYMHDIQLGDVVINPQVKKGRWKYKSDNKSTLAKALGIPVAHSDTELDTLLTQEARVAAAEKGLKEVREVYDIKYSVVDYKDVILELQKQRDEQAKNETSRTSGEGHTERNP